VLLSSVDPDDHRLARSGLDLVAEQAPTKIDERRR
jgi:hypothetical protein